VRALYGQFRLGKKSSKHVELSTLPRQLSQGHKNTTSELNGVPDGI
jgi:hypothetical protein